MKPFSEFIEYFITTFVHLFGVLKHCYNIQCANLLKLASRRFKEKIEIVVNLGNLGSNLRLTVLTILAGSKIDKELRGKIPF